MSVQRGPWCGRFLATVLAVLLVSAAQEAQQYSSGSPIAVAGGPGNVVLGDVNQDGKPDLVVASGRDRSITVLLGQGDGRFRAARGSPAQVPGGPSEMVLRDLNG